MAEVYKRMKTASTIGYLLHSPELIIRSISKILNAFEDVVQVELLKTRWGEIKRLQINLSFVNQV